jgi:competence protein ComEA
MADGSRGTVAVWLLAVGLGALALVRLLGGGGGGAAEGAPVRVDRSPSGAGPVDGGRRRGGGGAGGIYIHVAGAVYRPGLVRVPAGSRVALAVQRAGGPARKADLTGVNLAATLEDGQQVVVPVAAAGAAAASVPSSGGPASGASAGAKPSLGTATVEQLEELDGIGPTLAERIVEYRTEHGGFRSLGELREVEGIGEKRFESLSEALQP